MSQKKITSREMGKLDEELSVFRAAINEILEQIEPDSRAKFIDELLKKLSPKAALLKQMRRIYLKIPASGAVLPNGVSPSLFNEIDTFRANRDKIAPYKRKRSEHSQKRLITLLGKAAAAAKEDNCILTEEYLLSCLLSGKVSGPSVYLMEQYFIFKGMLPEDKDLFSVHSIECEDVAAYQKVVDLRKFLSIMKAKFNMKMRKDFLQLLFWIQHTKNPDWDAPFNPTERGLPASLMLELNHNVTNGDLLAALKYCRSPWGISGKMRELIKVYLVEIDLKI